MNKTDKKSNKKKRPFPVIWILIVFGVFYLLSNIKTPLNVTPQEITYSEFYRILKDSPGKIKSVAKTENLLRGEFSDGSWFYLNIPENDQDLIGLLRQLR